MDDLFKTEKFRTGKEFMQEDLKKIIEFGCDQLNDSNEEARKKREFFKNSCSELNSVSKISSEISLGESTTKKNLTIDQNKINEIKEAEDFIHELDQQQMDEFIPLEEDSTLEKKKIWFSG